METKSKIITTERIGQEQREKLKELIDLYANYEPNLLMNPDWKIIGKEYYVPDVLKVLDRIKLGKSYSDLKLIAYKPREYEFETILAWYTAFDGTMPDGKPMNVVDPKLLVYLDVDRDAESVWQAFVLDSLWCAVMPLWGHAGYNRIRIILGPDDLETLPLFEMGCPVAEPIAFTEDMLPYVEWLDDGRAIIHFCYWNDWGGLFHSHRYVSWPKHGGVVMTRPTHKNLYKYNCGILF